MPLTCSKVYEQLNLELQAVWVLHVLTEPQFLYRSVLFIMCGNRFGIVWNLTLCEDPCERKFEKMIPNVPKCVNRVFWERSYWKFSSLDFSLNVFLRLSSLFICEISSLGKFFLLFWAKKLVIIKITWVLQI